MADIKPIEISNFNLGGQADSRFSGIKNSLAKLIGFNLHDTPGLLRVRQKLSKISETIVEDATDGVDAFCKVGIACSDGNWYFFSSTTGKVWKVTSAFAVSKVHTTTPDSGDAGCLDAKEYNGYIYWATEKRLHRIAISDLADWSDATEDWAELNLDQAALGSTGDVYTLTTGVNEGATHRQTYTPAKSPLEAVGVNIGDKGTGDWTVTIHDAANASIGTKTITNANLAAGWNIFEFASVLYPVVGDAHHVHFHSTVADGTIVSSTNEDLEDGNIKIYTTSDDEFHPMEIQNLVLFIGDRHLVHQVDAQTFSRDALDIVPPNRIKCLGKIGTDLLIGTFIASNVSKGEIFRWNTFSVSFSSSDQVDEVGINAFLPGDNYVIVNAGLSGNLYYYNGQVLELFKRVPGDYSSTAQAIVHPNSASNLQGLILFGVSNSTGNPCDQGVYAIGKHSRNYPLVLDLSFPISERSDGDFVLSSIEIGAIAVSGFDAVIAWKNGSAFGFDKIDYSNKLDGAYFESRVEALQREILQNFGKFLVAYETIPASCDIDIAYQTNHAGSYTALTTIKDTDRLIKYNDSVTPNGNTIQMKVTITASSNTAPSIESCGIFPREE